MIIVIMGVSGSGKTTIGRLLAAELMWPFYDGDAFHPQDNIRKMAQGAPLTDKDRSGWLAALARLIDGIAREGRSAVIACSALKQSYRNVLTAAGSEVRFLYLQGDAVLMRERMLKRQHHFMPADLLDSQFETLEEPRDAVIVDAGKAPEIIVGEVRRILGV